MSKTRNRVNPFYVLLVLVGVLFTVTACSYFVMALQADKFPAETFAAIQSGEGLIWLMDRHGLAILIVELVVLAAATVAAIGSDGYWRRRGEQSQRDSDDRRQETPAEKFSPDRTPSERGAAL